MEIKEYFENSEFIKTIGKYKPTMFYRMFKDHFAIVKFEKEP